MDIRDGALRLWVIFSTLFVLGGSVSSYRTIREEFTAAGVALGVPLAAFILAWSLI